jgi:hypothetical protein
MTSETRSELPPADTFERIPGIGSVKLRCERKNQAIILQTKLFHSSSVSRWPSTLSQSAHLCAKPTLATSETYDEQTYSTKTPENIRGSRDGTIPRNGRHSLRRKKGCVRRHTSQNLTSGLTTLGNIKLTTRPTMQKALTMH